MTATGTLIIEGPALAGKIPEITVPQFVRDHFRRYGEEVALVDGLSGRSITFRALDQLIGRCAAGLAAEGFKPGDTLLICAPNSPEWPIAALGAMAAGGIVSGANPMYDAAELARQMREVNARFVLTIPPLLDRVREAAAAAGCETVIVWGDVEGTLSFASLLACENTEPAVASDPDDLAALPFSSGTSGLPKGVMLTHRNLVSIIRQVDEVGRDTEAMVTLAFLPMFHIYGFTVVMLYGLVRGARLVTVPRFEPDSFVKALQDHRVTHLYVVPPIAQFLATHPLVDAHDLTSLVYVGCGAAPLRGTLESRAAERLRCEFVQGFGMTESAGVVTTTYPEKKRAGSSGQPLPGTQVRIVDPDTGIDVGRDVPGEIWFRGPQAFKGYLNRPDATAETITADGWIRTGDLGYIDAEGYLFLTDRIKELIKVKGFQVAPAELEALLYTHPSVGDAAVIGRLDERAGEVPVAYVVPRDPLDREELKAWVAQRVIEYKQLGDVVLCESIPKALSGKILRRVLRAQDAERTRAAGG